MSSTPSSSDGSAGNELAADDLSNLTATARLLVDAIAAEPVPERLRALALELGKALDRQRKEHPASGS